MIESGSNSPVRVLSVLAVLVLPLAFACLGCSSQAQTPWKSPASKELLDQLEARTLQGDLSVDQRSMLLYLWGQELAAQAQSSQDPKQAAQLRQSAIGAFLRIVDAGSPPELVGDSRINLEILWRQEEQQKQQDQSRDQSRDQNQQEQDQKDKQQQDSDQQDSRQGQDQQKDQQEKGTQDQQKDQKGQNKSPEASSKDARDSKDSKDQESNPRDLSGLVREKPQDSRIDQALAGEQERKAREEARTRDSYRQSGGIQAVEQDW